MEFYLYTGRYYIFEYYVLHFTDKKMEMYRFFCMAPLLKNISINKSPDRFKEKSDCVLSF